MTDFKNETLQRILAAGENEDLLTNTRLFVNSSISAQYSYNFSSLGRPIIQYPQDMVALHEIIWQVRPDLIIECGIAHGGSLIHNATMLATLFLVVGWFGKTAITAIVFLADPHWLSAHAVVHWPEPTLRNFLAIIILSILAACPHARKGHADTRRDR